ncbi:MAG: TlpA family protein disulfide reductase [Proteobacteria bacterium]|nr:TlpA family protein disulfide reductase [Pseudomonadota bacterium]
MTDTPSVANPSRRLWLYGAAAVLAAGAGAGAALWKRHPAGGKHEALDAEFWGKKFEQPGGGELSLQALRGKPILLNFWATWCAPCVEEMPMLDRFFREHAANGIQVVGLAIDQPSAVRKFLQRTPVTYPIGLAGLDGTELIRALGNTAGGLPFTLALTADGAVAERKMGKLEQADLDTWRREFFHG